MRSRLSLSVLAFLSTPVAWAQVQEFRVNTYTVGDQSRPAAAMDPSGNFVVVWQSPQDGSGTGIFGQRFHLEGTPLGTEFQVNSFTTGGQARPSAAMDDSGRIVIVWESPQDGSGSGIFGRRFDTDGAPLGVEFEVNSYTSGAQVEPDVAADEEGGFMVVWQSRLPGTYSEIRARRFDATGSPMGDEFTVSGPGVFFNDTDSPAVATGSDGEFVVAYHTEYYHDVRVQPSSGGCDLGVTRSDAGFDVEMAPSGDYVVAFVPYVFESGDIKARRYHSCNEFGESAVNVRPENVGFSPSLAGDALGNFIVTWVSEGEGSGTGIFARRFHAQGEGLGPEFLVNSYTPGNQDDPVMAMNGSGGSILAWQSSGQDGSGVGIYARRLTAVNPVGMSVDRNPAAIPLSNLNGLLEVGETVRIEPEWRNPLVQQLDLTGVASELGGPPGPSYEITDGSADYGSVPAGGLARCADATGDCYEISISGSRPSDHWDAFLVETLSNGDVHSWTLHVAESFGDVPPSHMFYADVEILFHNGVAEGCGVGSYCPDEPVRRDQMAVFLLKARYGGSYVPPPCTGVFTDVACPGQFADWIEQLFAEGITGGCGVSIYCPSSSVTRAQMSAFLLKAEHGSSYTPPACNDLFADVPCPSLFADWIEQLFHESITAGCGGGNYCPDRSSTRGQMAAFLVRTFGLQLYGP
jgi:S-layer homology domain